MTEKSFKKPQDLVLIDGTKPTKSQINFLRKARLPKISTIDLCNLGSFIDMEAQTQIEIPLQSRFLYQEAEKITISRGELFSLAEIKTNKGSERLVRLIYQKIGGSPEAAQTSITWQEFLDFKRAHWILPFEVYQK